MRFRCSHASELNHISYVCVEHLGKHFSALSKLREGDEFSKFTGCRFAEQKAEIKAVKYELQLEKLKRLSNIRFSMLKTLPQKQCSDSLICGEKRFLR